MARICSEVGSRNPITGIAGCCARTTSGESNVEPAKALIKSRLRTGSSTQVRKSFLQILSDKPSAGRGCLSALGQKQTCAAHSRCPLSAKTGLYAAQQTVSLFDHLIGSHEHALWHSDAKRSRRFQINCQLEFVGRSIGRSAGLAPLRISQQNRRSADALRSGRHRRTSDRRLGRRI